MRVGIVRYRARLNTRKMRYIGRCVKQSSDKQIDCSAIVMFYRSYTVLVGPALVYDGIFMCSDTEKLVVYIEGCVYMYAGLEMVLFVNAKLKIRG